MIARVVQPFSDAGAPVAINSTIYTDPVRAPPPSTHTHARTRWLHPAPAPECVAQHSLARVLAPAGAGAGAGTKDALTANGDAFSVVFPG